MKILQFGTGVFIRGYFDWMLQELADKSILDAHVTVVKLTERGDLSQYEKQKGVFHALMRGLENGQTVDELRKIDRIKDFIHPYNEWDKFLASAKDPDMELIVSNSTEAGLVYESTTTYSSCPASFPAKLYRWLKERFVALGAGSPVMIMAFELVPDNASKLKQILLKLATEDSATPELLSWLSESCTYINTLVDRIVSKLPSSEVEKLQQEYALEDDLILCAEPYHLLAVDSEELEKVLPLKAAGLNIEVSEDLGAIRDKKVKILNGAHMLVVPAGLALGEQIVLETLENKAIRGFTVDCLSQEVAATVSDPQVDRYIASVIERFENPFLNHRLENIALNSSAKIGQRLFPSIVDFYKETGRYPEKLMTAVAIYLEFYQGELMGPGKLKASWGTLVDDAAAMNFLLSLQGMDPATASRTIIEKHFWPLPEHMEETFIVALATSIKQVREIGIEKSL